MSRWATFDCYGTLIDWNAGIGGALARLYGAEQAPALLRRYHELEDMLCRPEIVGDRAQFQKLSKERSEIEPVANAFEQYDALSRDIASSEAAVQAPVLPALMKTSACPFFTRSTATEIESSPGSTRTMMCPAMVGAPLAGGASMTVS